MGPRFQLATQCIGSMPFISPEFLCGTATDGATGDVWSLAVVLLEMLYGLGALAKACDWHCEKRTMQECGEQLQCWFVDPVGGLSRVRLASGIVEHFEGDPILASMLHAD